MSLLHTQSAHMARSRIMTFVTAAVARRSCEEGGVFNLNTVRDSGLLTALLHASSLI